MSIVIIRQDDKIELWKKALQEAAPDIKVYSYLEEHPVDEIDVVLVWKHPKGTIAKYPNLKYIACSGAGVDFIFEDETAPTNIPITRVVDTMLASDMSEYVIAAIFSHIKRFYEYKINQIKSLWNPKQYHRIADYTVGILGLGALGAVLAKDLVRFGFKTQGWSNSRKEIPEVTAFAGQEELGEFLAMSEILVCLLPLTDETSGILNKELFKQLPKGAFVINAARGGHLVDKDLIEMLDNEHLSGATLDVFHQEPLSSGHPFWKHEKIHITPHYASVSDTASVVPQIIENYHRMQRGESLLNLVSTEKGY
ncbi:glyoxylate/hydroxypyruvate reductase A [Maribacter algarum]|uniref:Glyoxylate/hydroxypyruvate reductase A n=1 Tax=Maribacter algarum (ex Zhang et al. 2020) TaxID=2578118 RepID=A0A5S3PTW5_9FLAO|nr:glyoxylate/hydroxypyruvate reductase A [Maribacter algarum]TMM57363.1 glyoxylate/hydroxypyruvate reductase A [Maribacter algarum]